MYIIDSTEFNFLAFAVTRMEESGCLQVNVFVSIVIMKSGASVRGHFRKKSMKSFGVDFCHAKMAEKHKN